MGAVREVDAISDAIIETEKEIAGDAWDIEDTEALDASGSRSLEEMGEGLEGQHEAEDELEAEAEGEEAAEGEGQGEGEGEGEEEQQPRAAKGKEGETEPQERQGQQPSEGRVPSAKLREANERARAAEARAAEIEAARVAERDRVAALEAQMLTLTQLLQGQRQPPQPREEPRQAPDIFENPTGFADHLQQSFQTGLSQFSQQLQQMRVENSFAIAHALQQEAFEEAMTEINKLNVQNPEDRATVQRIYNASNPGQALVGWHKRNKALAEVGDDPASYRQRVQAETREALMKDPEFIKQVAASLRQDAMNGNDGRPRTTTRLPKSLNAAAGSNLGTGRVDPHALDDSDQAVAESAWR